MKAMVHLVLQQRQEMFPIQLLVEGMYMLAQMELQPNMQLLIQQPLITFQLHFGVMLDTQRVLQMMHI